MARNAEKFKARYSSGLEDKAIRKRSVNKSRILQLLGATDLDWNKWSWHIKNIIRNEDTLSKLIKLKDEEYNAIQAARKYRIPFGITPYYASLMDYKPDRSHDYAIRSQVIPSLHYVKKLKQMKECSESSMDFMIERDTTPIEGITRRYPNIVILKPVLSCPQICVYCQRNWEIEDVYSSSAV
ncbi:MAG: KamA family radical SAM protein, partial [bacterium]|nr:KamA family radical SAM protein [bacterium]